MIRKTRNVRAQKDEWIHVQRHHSPHHGHSASGWGSLLQLLLQVGAILFGLYIIITIMGFVVENGGMILFWCVVFGIAWSIIKR